MIKGYPCACCGYLTMSEARRGSFDICPICFWEDDGYQFRNPDSAGGANKVSLNQARENFKKFGVSELAYISKVRKPTSDEIP